MNTTAVAVSEYEQTLADLQDAYTALDRTWRTILGTAEHLRGWSRANTDTLIDALPLDWPDAQQLVAALARYGRARTNAVQAWRAISPSLRQAVTAPEQFLSIAEEGTVSSGMVHPAKIFPAAHP